MSFSWLLFFFFLSWSDSIFPAPWNLSLVSWNVNGAAKFRSYYPELQYLSTFDVILLQETFTVDDRPSLDLNGYITFHTPARGRHQWGMTSYFRITSFAGGHMRSIQAPGDWLQVCSLIIIGSSGSHKIKIFGPEYYFLEYFGDCKTPDLNSLRSFDGHHPTTPELFL
jgi:hypothetical protein